MRITAKDPICGMFVDESTADLKATVRGTTYYFCSEACLKEFTAPEVELKKLKILVALGAILTIPILVLTYLPVLGARLSNFVLLLLTIPVQFVVGARFYRGAYHALKSLVTNMDVLIAVGTTAAFLYSLVVTFYPAMFGSEGVYYDTAAVIITLILTGRLLEHYSKGKASESIRKLLDLRPTVAHVVKGETVTDVPVEMLSEGDIFEVKPGERIPTDAKVIFGGSSVDESIITGESMPVEKVVGSELIGASINKTGYLRAVATKVGQDTTLAQITKLVEESQAGKAPIQRLVDRIAEYFVPAVIAVASASAILWYVVGRVPFVTSVLVFVSVVIIACPCALGIATPAALLVGTAKGAQSGILLKGGEALESAGRIDTAVFDKTGTLTMGKPSVTAVVGDAERILRLAASVEAGSEHPLAEAIVNEARSKGLKFANATGFESLPGLGVMGTVDGEAVLLGKRDLMAGRGIDVSALEQKAEALESEGATVVFLSSNGEALGLIAVSDTLKPDSQKALSELHEMGIETIMLTGDNQRTAEAIGRSLGMTRIYANVLPQEKERKIEELQNEGRKVAMVGDGINDAPALARADLGVAIGSGTDVAKETGGIVLIKDNLLDVVRAIQLSRAALRKIKQNLFWAFCYNVGLVPIAAGILIPFYGVSIYSFLPFFAGAAMAFSSVTVVSNSLLLSRFRPTA